MRGALLRPRTPGVGRSKARVFWLRSGLHSQDICTRHGCKRMAPACLVPARKLRSEERMLVRSGVEFYCKCKVRRDSAVDHSFLDKVVKRSPRGLGTLSSS